MVKQRGNQAPLAGAPLWATARASGRLGALLLTVQLGRLAG